MSADCSGWELDRLPRSQVSAAHCVQVVLHAGFGIALAAGAPPGPAQPYANPSHPPPCNLLRQVGPKVQLPPELTARLGESPGGVLMRNQLPAIPCGRQGCPNTARYICTEDASGLMEAGAQALAQTGGRTTSPGLLRHWRNGLRPAEPCFASWSKVACALPVFRLHHRCS